MVILGLDLSLMATGYCVITNNTITCKGVIESKDRGMLRLEYIRKRVCNILESINLDLVVIEGYSMGSRGGMVFSIGELGGIIKHLVWSLGYKVIIVPPKTLKKFITNNGNSGKDLMILKAYIRYNEEFSNNNECDAFCLAKLGKAYLYGTDIQYENECIKKVELL